MKDLVQMNRPGAPIRRGPGLAGWTQSHVFNKIARRVEESGALVVHLRVLSWSVLQAMAKQIIEVPVADLEIGFYVSRLDRPWAESPFLFQGFEIETEEELAQLRQLCRSVQIEVSAPEAPEILAGRPKHVGKPSPQIRSDALSEVSGRLTARLASVPEKDSIPLKTELAKAKTAFGEAKLGVADLFDRLRRGAVLDVRTLETVVDSMVDSVFRNREAMSWLARMKSKDNYLYNHSLAGSVWALAFGRHLGLDKDTLRSVGVGAMLLDVGKTKLSDELLKKSGKPAGNEWHDIRLHVEYGLELVEDDPKADERVKIMIRTHHERMDGSGYPEGLNGDAIPLLGRIAGIVDSYDAMTSDRIYAKGKSTYEAVRELKGLGGTWFQPELIDLFIQAVGVFPTGTLVELNTGEVGVVVAQNRFRRLRPELMLILDGKKRIRDEFSLIDLQMCQENNTDGNPGLWIIQGLEPGAYGIDPTEYFL
jgi:HD-GYP domain-containing protein (c-di-GMP phosphodiesterase class II)